MSQFFLTVALSILLVAQNAEEPSLPSSSETRSPPHSEAEDYGLRPKDAEMLERTRPQLERTRPQLERTRPQLERTIREGKVIPITANEYVIERAAQHEKTGPENEEAIVLRKEISPSKSGRGSEWVQTTVSVPRLTTFGWSLLLIPLCVLGLFLLAFFLLLRRFRKLSPFSLRSSCRRR